MRVKSWALASTVFIMFGGFWASYIISSRAFLRDFNTGVHAYLSGQFEDAEDNLKKALGRRPHNEEAKQLLSKVLIERSFLQYHKKNFTAAVETLDRASQSLPANDEAQGTLVAL